MQMLVIVLNRIEKLNDLLLELNQHDISGGTIIDSSGMMKTLVDSYPESFLFSALRSALSESRPFNKTLFMVLSDEKIPIAMNCVRKVISDLKDNNIGVMFTLPINEFEILSKHRR